MKTHWVIRVGEPPVEVPCDCEPPWCKRVVVLGSPKDWEAEEVQERAREEVRKLERERKIRKLERAFAKKKRTPRKPKVVPEPEPLPDALCTQDTYEGVTMRHPIPPEADPVVEIEDIEAQDYLLTAAGFSPHWDRASNYLVPRRKYLWNL